MSMPVPIFFGSHGLLGPEIIKTVFFSFSPARPIGSTSLGPTFVEMRKDLWTRPPVKDLDLSMYHLKVSSAKMDVAGLCINVFGTKANWIGYCDGI